MAGIEPPGARGTTTRRREARGGRVAGLVGRGFAASRGLLYAAAFVALWGWVVTAARPLDTRIPLTIAEAWRGAGVALAVIGAAVDLACVLAFAWAGLGTPAPFDAPRRFVAVGPYRVVRNPMYLGAILVLIGVGLALGSPAALGVAALFVALAHGFVVLYEEPILERRFGDDYRTYRREVSRWVPGRPARPRPGSRAAR